MLAASELRIMHHSSEMMITIHRVSQNSFQCSISQRRQLSPSRGINWEEFISYLFLYVFFTPCSHLVIDTSTNYMYPYNKEHLIQS